MGIDHEGPILSERSVIIYMPFPRVLVIIVIMVIMVIMVIVVIKVIKVIKVIAVSHMLISYYPRSYNYPAFVWQGP